MVGGSEGESSYETSVSTRGVESSACYRYLRGTAHLDPLLLENVPFDDKNEASLVSSKYRKLGSGPGEFVEVLGFSPPSEARNPSVSARLLESLQLEDVESLIQSFFDIVHPIFPILDQAVFCTSYERRTVDPPLLAAVCVVSGAWLSTTRRISTERYLSNTEAILHEHLGECIDRPSITTLQAGLLLTQCPNHTSRHLSAQLLSFAFDLGLHQDCSDWNIDSQEKSSRRRLAWALYAQDKWSALLHGRPAQLTEANWMVQELCMDDFNIPADTEHQPTSTRQHGAQLFMEMLVVSQILGEILSSFYTLVAEHSVRSSTPNSLRVVLARAKPIQINLRDWFSRLPASLKMDTEDANHAAHNGILHLAYFATEIALHRCIIRASASTTTTISSTPPPSTPNDDADDTYLTHICRSAAKTRLISAMDFVNRLKVMHFRAAWPLASPHHFALIAGFGVLLRATAPTREEAAFYRARLQEYRWTLVVTGRRAGFLAGAISLLDDGVELLEFVPEKMGVREFVDRHPRVLNGGGVMQQQQQGGSGSHGVGSGRLSEAFGGFDSPDTSTSGEEEEVAGEEGELDAGEYP